MDLASVPSTIVSLLRSAESVRRRTRLLIPSNTHADRLAQSVLQKVSTTEASLLRLRGFLESDKIAICEAISLEQLNTVLTGCLRRFSELESDLSTVQAADSRANSGPDWTQCGRRLTVVLERLQLYNVSLAFILKSLEHQPLSKYSPSVEPLQREIERLKNCILSDDPDLAVCISKSVVASRSETASIASGAASIMSQPPSPVMPGRDLTSVRAAKQRDGLRGTWWSKNRRSDDSARLSDRPASSDTTVSFASACTVTTASTSSWRSHTAPSEIHTYSLPMTATDVSAGKRYLDTSLESRGNSLGNGETDGRAAIEASVATKLPTAHHTALPLRVRPESRASSLATRPPAEGKKNASPKAEIEMTARKYQGYWRASFTANVPAAMAMCGSSLLLASSSSSSPSRATFTENEDVLDRANDLCDSLNSAGSPAKVMYALHAHTLETTLFALKTSLASSELAVVSAKTASGLYQKIAEAEGDAKKRQKAWQHLARALKKMPQETLVPLIFLVVVGRRLTSRGVTVGKRSAAVYLMRSLWPPSSSRSPSGLDSDAGDAVSQLLLDHFDDLPDELPVILQALNYRFESGSRCNLLSLFSTKKPRSSPGEYRMSTDTT